MLENGYLLKKSFLSLNDCEEFETILLKFHESWIKDNQDFFNDRAINSAYITSGKYISGKERMTLLKLVASSSVIKLAKEFLGEDVRFLNTQLFFDPVNILQKNYWHRDIQYSGMSLEDQKKIVKKQGHEVVHFRLALRNEEGIEVVPNSDSRWDTNLELNTRLEINKRAASDDLLQGVKLALNKSDLLIFDANMIHRGLYGKNRLSFDILFCKNDPEILKYADKNCFPSKDELVLVDHPEVFAPLT